MLGFCAGGEGLLGCACVGANLFLWLTGLACDRLCLYTYVYKKALFVHLCIRTLLRVSLLRVELEGGW